MLSPGLPDPGVCGPDRRGRCLPRLPGASRPAPAPMPGSHREDPVSLAWESPPSRPPPTLSGSVGLDTPWLTRRQLSRSRLPPLTVRSPHPASARSQVSERSRLSVETLRPPHRLFLKTWREVRLRGGQGFSRHHTPPPRPEKGKVQAELRKGWAAQRRATRLAHVPSGLLKHRPGQKC